ncbi:MAG: SURF1 family protein [Comamonadaceae bacterium]|nr:MAG: SURF1 family protein [Comamonadaceae bacterium]
MRRIAFAAAALLVFVGLVALGTWQVQRRAWKLDLIERVNARVHAAAAEAPPAEQPPSRADEYRHVRVSGTYLHDRETLVQAVTDLGSGFWVLTPLRRAEGGVVLINRGFVPPEARDPAARATDAPQGETTVVGLLRLSEPGGGFLRKNDAAGNRWFSRDVQAIAQARGLGPVAPYFIDAEAGPAQSPPRWPAGGLTVIAFHNNHLVYALTWYALAAMVAAGAAYALRSRRTAPDKADA